MVHNSLVYIGDNTSGCDCHHSSRQIYHGMVALLL